MKFKITEISDLQFKVEYDDGTWAIIPSVAGQDKNYYLGQIKHFAPKHSVVKVADHPMKIADEGTVGAGYTAPSQPETTMDYKWARAMAYTSMGGQFDAAMKARKGDDTEQKAHDAHQLIVKAKFPKDSKMYTASEWDAAIVELKKDSAWVTE